MLVVDEAAAIPLPLVKSLLGPYLVFLSSTINGYEGTGRSLSLKLIKQLRQQTSTQGQKRETVSYENPAGDSISGRSLREVSLEEPIRYGKGDHVEKWLYRLLCLDASTVDFRIIAGTFPPPPHGFETLYRVFFPIPLMFA